MQHHPDKNPDDPLAHETFQKIGQAYETLSDPNERAAYDRYGPSGSSSRPPNGTGGGNHDDPFDLFEQMFGGFGSFQFGPDDDGFGPGGSSSSRRRTKGRDTVVPYEISLEQAYVGKKVVMNLQRDRVCGGCDGSGGRAGAKKVKCSKCEGRGFTFTNTHIGAGLVGKMRITCTDCGGAKEKLRDKDKCKKCKGDKVLKEKKKVEFYIEPGTMEGERIALKGEGDEEPGTPPGDVIFHIRITPHPILTRRSLNSPDLNLTSRLSLSEALLGFDRLLLIHLDGRGLRIESKAGEKIIQHGSEWVVKGEGMPIRGGGGGMGRRKGDLYVKFEVEMPGPGWASRQTEGTKVQLPGPLPEIASNPAVVETKFLSPA